MDSIPTGAQWSWPSSMDPPDGDLGDNEPAPPPTPPHPQQDPDSTGAAPGPSAQSRPQRRRYYRPRTCRICLEEVFPKTDIDESLGGALFGSRARVRYVSDDPELGRLISPCKCKGSQKYVHEGCLQAWRLSQPLADRNFWQCPTCQFQYRMQRLRYGRWLSSKVLRAAITMSILLFTVFLLGFVADPIINLWVDPLGSVVEVLSDADGSYYPILDDDQPGGWWYHFAKGFMSLGLLGFLKTFFAMSPWHWFNVRAGVGGRRRGTGRDRMESINYVVVIVGVFTFLGATWKLVSHLTERALEKATEQVVDIQEDDDEDEDDEAGQPAINESRKDR
ncbi:hypothetical protein B0H66DRAFT_341457 [Apodospora peruviana]|uniref:RING-CH-type domain-containing protein n=1 Tax=Apodospora peruviana TaxID=516989 RepID=A0AAE0HYQ0_9PEZI|nr:hypothetical protein B0H66DRAFT_341457 [Apodospora peruviana]